VNSERIERRFGSYGVDVIERGPTGRVSSLYSLHGARKVCRTYATVEFGAPVRREFAREHERVLSGESIGSVFKGAGWHVRKRHVQIGETTLTGDDGTIAELMHLGLPCTVALHTYVFEIARGGATFYYASITELHHPEYLAPEELRSIFTQDSGR
jgi:hypothetical protein